VVGEIAGVCRRTIQRWLKWYREGGLRENGEAVGEWLSGKAWGGFGCAAARVLAKGVAGAGFSDDRRGWWVEGRRYECIEAKMATVKEVL